MMRAAIYARMSTDRQSEDSPADQIARCRDFAQRKGWHVVEGLAVADEAVSGASRHYRPAFLRLFERIDEWDVLLCWDYSRLTRDLEDFGWLVNQLRDHERTAFDCMSGRDVFDLSTQFMGVVNYHERLKISENTRRGMRGRAERGLATGGAPFGYRIGADGRLAVDGDAAAVVRRIFEWSALGEGLRVIARQLNAEGVPAPRPRRNAELGPSWSPTALQAMLENPVYRGELVFGRSRWVKLHGRKARRRKLLPESEWIRREAPELAIVSPELWERVRAVKAERRRVYVTRPGGGLETTRAGAGHRGRGRHLLAGFLVCGECGGSVFDVHGSGHLGCGWHRDRGPEVCGNDLRVLAADVEARFLGAVRERILTPANVAWAVERALELVAEERRRADPREIRRQLAALDAGRERLLELVERGAADLDEVAPRLERQRADVVELRRRLAESEAEWIDPEGLRAAIEAEIRDVREALVASPDERRRALLALLRDRRIRVKRDDATGFRLEGVFRVALELETARDLEGSAGRLAFGSGGGI